MRYTFERVFQNIIPDIKDNLALNEPAIIVESKGEERKMLLEKLISREKREQLVTLARNLEKKGAYRTLSVVGEKEKGTSHPHLFVIERDDEGIQLLFVDPEHMVGKRNLLRPRIGNLVSLRIYDGERDPELAILRFRTPKIEERDITLLKLQPQLEAAKTLIKNDGVPEFLKDFPEEIIFRSVIKSDKALVQARYSSQSDLKSFLEGEKGSSILEGKVNSQNAIVNRFIHFLEEGRFEKVQRNE